MGRYIDVEQLEKDGWAMQRTYQSSPTEITCERKKPTDFPAADVVEVRHGKWTMIDKGHHFYDWECSVCGGSGRADYAFCPNCGSRMDLDGERNG